jgi:hypothetical protein
VRPALRVDPALGALLDPVVTDRLGGPDRLVQLRLADGDVAALLGQAAPRPGVAVGLQLHRHRQLVLPRRVALLRGPHLGLGAEQRLQVVARLVRHDVRHREAALRPELLLQLTQEADVDEDLPVRRAVERPDLGRGLAAAGLHALLEEGQPRLLVLRPAPRQLGLPRLVDLVVDLDQVAVVVPVDRTLGVAAPGQLLRGLPAALPLHLPAGRHQLRRVDVAAADDVDQQVDQQADDPHAAPADGQPAAAPASVVEAPDVDVLVGERHCCLLLGRPVD